MGMEFLAKSSGVGIDPGGASGLGNEWRAN
jgi:hypothetical protein